MGFRTGAYATIWGVEPKSDKATKLRISISRKNKMSGEYEQDFSGFVSAVGTAAAQKAAKLKERDRIKLGDVDVTTTYDKTANKEYVNYKIFSFEMADEAGTTSATPAQSNPVQGDEVDEDMLPF